MDRPRIKNPASRIVLTYLLIGCFSLLFSDRLIYHLSDRDMQAILHTAKGWLFVASSAVLIYYLVQRYVSQIDAAQNEIEASEQRLARALATSHMGVWEWDLRSDRVLWSPESYQIVGLADFDGRFASFAPLLHPDDAERVVATVQKALADHSAYTDEFRIIRPDGQTRWLCNHGDTRYADDGTPLVLLGTVQDVTERKRIEQELQASEMRYRAVVEDQTEVVTRYRPDGTYTFINDAYCRIMGKTREELLGSGWHPDAYPEDLELVEEALRKMSPDHPVAVIENRVIWAQGEVRWMQFVNRGFFDEGGRLVETQAVGRDITERKLAEEELLRRELYYRTIIDRMYEGFQLLDPLYDERQVVCDVRYVDLNEGFERATGLRRDDILGKRLKQIFPDVESYWFEMFDRVLRTGEPTSQENYNHNTNRYYETSFFLLEQTRIGGIIRDITERKRAEAALREANELLESRVSERTAELEQANRLLEEEIRERKGAEERIKSIALFPEQNPSPILRVSADGVVQYANRAATSLLDCWHSRNGTPIPDAVRDDVNAALADGRKREVEICCAEHTFLAVLSPIPEQQYVNFYCTNITERKRDELELARYRGHLEMLVAERTSELEIRNMQLDAEVEQRTYTLEVLRKYSRRMLELEEELRRKLAEELHDEIGRDVTALGLTLAIVHDHLQEDVREKLSDRLEDARVTLETISCTVRGLMAKLRPPVLDDYGLPAALRWHCELYSKRTGLAVDLSMDNDFPRLPAYKELALFRIAQEAMANASRYAEARCIRVALNSTEETLNFSVSDDGIGFDTDLAWRKKDESHWGLTMMQERTQAIDGVFRLDSAPGKGTTILVTLEKGA